MADILNSELSVSLHLFRSTHNIESSHFFSATWRLENNVPAVTKMKSHANLSHARGNETTQFPVARAMIENIKIGPHSVHVWLTITIKLNYHKKMRHEHFEVKISPYYKWPVIEFEITQLKS